MLVLEERAVRGNVLQAVLDSLEALAHLCLQAQHTKLCSSHMPCKQAYVHWLIHALQTRAQQH